MSANTVALIRTSTVATGWRKTVWQCLPLVTELAGEAVEVIDVLLGPHDHLEGWDELATGRTVPRHAKQPDKTKKDSSLSEDPPQSYKEL